MVDIIGLTASLLVVFSMIFKTTTYKGTMLMRTLNLIGSVFFIVYGMMLPAYATAVTNMAVFVLNIVYLVKEYKDHNNKQKENENNGSKKVS